MRLERLVGVPLTDLTFHHVVQLVDGQVDEGFDLDFKGGLYGKTDSDKAEMAADVAALANVQGGLLLLGVEDDNGRASGITPVPLDEDELLRIQHVITSKIVPVPEFEFIRVPKAEGATEGYIGVIVGRSDRQPHAVVVEKGFRFPKRETRGKRWMSETEIADAYRSRFQQARASTDRLREIARQGEVRLDRDQCAWVTFTFVPAIPGEFEINASRLRALRDWPAFRERSLTRSLWSGLTEVGTGVRKVLLRSGSPTDAGLERYEYIELHRDGSLFCAIPHANAKRDRDGDNQGASFQINDEWLIDDALVALMFAREHAIQAGASGDVLTTLSIVPPKDANFPQLQLCHLRFQGFREITGRAAGELVTQGHTLDLDALNDSKELLIATRLLMTDVMNHFSIAEVMQITSDGKLRWNYFMRRSQDFIRDWANRHGIELIDETVGG